MSTEEKVVQYAFRCKQCGRLHEAEHAGDNELPHACQVCGEGVRHGPDFRGLAEELCKPDLPAERRKQIADHLRAGHNDTTKTLVQSNWEVLSDCTPERLKELGLTKGQVKRHDGKGQPNVISTKVVAAYATEGTKVKDSSDAKVK